MRSGKESNFSIWDQVKHTNPKYTKPFTKFGGKELTTIDPMYQIQVMTGLFGPVGKGWSYDVIYHYTDKNVFAEVTVGWTEVEKHKALNINSIGVKNLVTYCEANNIKLIHFSTDYVYNSLNKKPISEDELIDPQNFIGNSTISL